MALKTNIVQVKVTYDAGKLLKRIPKIITNYCGRYARSSVTGAKENIDKGVVPPLRDITIDIRKKRNITGTKPLYETGELYRSMKGKNVEGGGELTMLRYGILHHKGFKTGSGSMIPNRRVDPRPFISPSKRTVLKVFDAFKRDVSRAFHKKGK